MSQRRPRARLVLSAAAAHAVVAAGRRAPSPRALAADERQAMRTRCTVSASSISRPRKCMPRCSRSRPTWGRCARCIACSRRPTKCGNGAPRPGTRCIPNPSSWRRARIRSVLGHHQAQGPDPVLYYALCDPRPLQPLRRGLDGRPPRECAPGGTPDCGDLPGRASPRSNSRSMPTAARPVRSKLVALLFSDLSINASHSRPRVSNDNPFSESQFRTLKYRPEFPDRDRLARTRARRQPRSVRVVQQPHHHSGLSYLTPGDVHYGRAAGPRRPARAPVR